MTICAASLSRGNLGHGHRLFLSHVGRKFLHPAAPAAKGVRQKEFGKKVTKKVTEASEKVTEK